LCDAGTEGRFRARGLFDPELVMYGEEVDFVWRARMAGLRCAAISTARMWHKVSLSANRVRAQTRYLQIRNQARFYNRYSRGLQRTGMFLFSTVRTTLLLLASIIRGNTSWLFHPIMAGWMAGRTITNRPFATFNLRRSGYHNTIGDDILA